MGLDLGPTDVAFRCNLVSLSDESDYAAKTMLDYSSDEISTEEARPLVEEVQRRLGTEAIAFHPGISYRHCMVWKGGPMACALTPPHDITVKPVRDYLPKGEASRGPPGADGVEPRDPRGASDKRRAKRRGPQDARQLDLALGAGPQARHPLCSRISTASRAR